MSNGRETGRFDAFDGLRALAVSLVFLTHVASNWCPGGFLGVTLFFALSGYLITTLLLAEHRQTRHVSLHRFYTRRFLRLMPALVVMVGITAAAGFVVGRGSTLRDAWPAVTYLMDIVAPITHNGGGIYGATWSLAVEEQFYLVWPIVLIVGLRRGWNLEWITVGFMAVCTAVTVVLTLHPSGQSLSDVYRLPTTHLPILGAGILLALAQGRGLGERFRAVAADPLVPVIAVGALLAGLVLVSTRTVAMYRGGWLLFAAVGTALVAHLVVSPAGVTARAFAARVPVWLGRRSYGFYLWQGPVILLLESRLHGAVITAVASLIVTLVITQASWVLVEQPFLRLKRRFEVAHQPLVEQVAAAPS